MYRHPRRSKCDSFRRPNPLERCVSLHHDGSLRWLHALDSQHTHHNRDLARGSVDSMTPCPTCKSTSNPKCREGAKTCQNCREKHRKWREERRPHLRQYAKEYRNAHPDKRRLYNKRYTQTIKRKVMDLYGRGCQCCGEEQLMFLTIDHVNDDGKQHRQELATTSASYGRGGIEFYKYLWREHRAGRDIPYVLQVLCWNCQQAKRWGTCPHQQTGV